jgi:hypothetical protein
VSNVYGRAIVTSCYGLHRMEEESHETAVFDSSVFNICVEFQWLEKFKKRGPPHTQRLGVLVGRGGGPKRKITTICFGPFGTRFHPSERKQYPTHGSNFPSNQTGVPIVEWRGPPTAYLRHWLQ